MRARALGAFLLLACACCPRPVLYPNEHLQAAGSQQSRRDISECRAKAKEYVRSSRAGAVAGETVAGGVAGAAGGAAAGAILGSAARGAAGGGAAGAAFGLVRGLFQAGGPSPTFKNFVNRCLSERGYEVVGWE